MGQICSICGSGEEPHQATAFADASSLQQGRVGGNTKPGGGGHPFSSLPNGSKQGGGLASSAPAHDFNLHGSGMHVLGSPDGGGDVDASSGGGGVGGGADSEARMAQYRLEQAELARRGAIVNEASQAMVPLGSQGGVSGSMKHHPQQYRSPGITYYDPAYAAAAAQDVLRCAAATGGLLFCDDRATRAALGASAGGTVPAPSSRVGGVKGAAEMLGRGRWDGVRLGSRGGGLAGCGGEDPMYYVDDLAEALLDEMVPTATPMFGGCSSIVENLP